MSAGGFARGRSDVRREVGVDVVAAAERGAVPTDEQVARARCSRSAWASGRLLEDDVRVRAADAEAR